MDDEFTGIKRGPNGRFPKGTSGNPGGMSKSKRRRRKEALELHDKALDLLRAQLEDHENDPWLEKRTPKGDAYYEHKISPGEMVRIAETLGKFGGVLTKEQEARLLIAIAGLRSSFKTEEEFQDFLAIASGRRRIQAPSQKQIMPAEGDGPRDTRGQVNPSPDEAGSIQDTYRNAEDE